MKRKKCGIWLLALLMVLCLMPEVKASEIEDSTLDVIYISTASDLKKISQNLDGTYVLKKDINLKSKKWTPIGTPDKPFTGFFDGAGHTIKNLSAKAEENYQGLFGYAKDAMIMNLSITGVVKGKMYVGAVAGQIVDTWVVACHNKAKVYGVDQVGGLVGRTSNTSVILNCQNDAAITGTGRCTGGITSDLYPSGATVCNCVNLGKVSGGNDLNGGITGGSTGGLVANCVNWGNVSGKGRSGAIAGDNASYAGSRYYNYFRKTSKVNAGFNVVGSNCATFAKGSGKLSAAVQVGQKTYTSVLSALNAGRKLLKKEKDLVGNAWKLSGSKVVLFK
ncbi:MAG: hypothetical protein IIZ39_01280 [Blautia sp.]|nr:hypothetical protein [Blautia sp.]